MRAVTAIAVIVFLLVVMAECGGSSPERDEPAPQRTREASPEPTVDASTKAACRHFRNVADDAQRGLLTDAELREKLREVLRVARIADGPGVERHAEGLFAAVTQRDEEAMKQHTEGLDKACREAGV